MITGNVSLQCTLCLRQVHQISTDSQQDALQICFPINHFHTGNNYSETQLQCVAYQRPKTYVSEWLNSRKHKYAVVLLLGLYLWSPEAENHRARISELFGKNTPCFIFNFLQLKNFLGQCTFTMKCIQISPEVN